MEFGWHWGPQLFLGLGRSGSLMVSEEVYSKLSENVAILIPGTPPFSEGGLWAWSPPHTLKSQRNPMP